MTSTHPSLADRVRALLAGEPSTREVPMFGALSFMVNDRMVVAARGDEGLLVRVDPAQNGDLIVLPGAEPAAMGTGRTMGPGWIQVAASALRTDERLSFWIGVALEYNADAPDIDVPTSDAARLGHELFDRDARW